MYYKEGDISMCGLQLWNIVLILILFLNLIFIYKTKFLNLPF